MNPSARSSSNLIEQFSRMEFLIIRLDAVSLAYSVYMGIHILRCGQRIVESLNCLLNNAVKDLEKLPNRGCGRNPGPNEVINRRRSRTCIPTKND